MTNQEIIYTEAILKGLDPAQLYTYQEWKNRGYQVQKGEKAILKTKLWKQVEKINKKTGEKEKKFYFVNASLFDIEQVKPIEQEKIA